MRDEFFEIFYNDLLKQSSEIEDLFKNTDWYKQKSLIKSAIKSAIMFAGNPELYIAREHLEKIAITHSHTHMNIKPEYYPIWRECMIRTVKKCDPNYSWITGRAWQKVLTFTINFMISKYDAV